MTSQCAEIRHFLADQFRTIPRIFRACVPQDWSASKADVLDAEFSFSFFLSRNVSQLCKNSMSALPRINSIPRIDLSGTSGAGGGVGGGGEAVVFAMSLCSIDRRGRITGMPGEGEEKKRRNKCEATIYGVRPLAR